LRPGEGTGIEHAPPDGAIFTTHDHNDDEYGGMSGAPAGPGPKRPVSDEASMDEGDDSTAGTDESQSEESLSFSDLGDTLDTALDSAFG